MIKIEKSKTADTRSCDFKKVTKDQLKQSSVQHIGDVCQGIDFMIDMLYIAKKKHDWDKLDKLDEFHSDFSTGFKQTTWFDNHMRVNRHHLGEEEGVPDDVNLIDVLEMVVDCVMAGLGRSGKVRPVKIDAEILTKAVTNTAKMLENEIVVVK